MVKYIFTALSFLALAVPSLAADKIVSRVDTTTADGSTSTHLNFFYESCEEECQVATFICSDTGSISIVLADIAAKNAAKAITKEKQQILLNVGKKQFEYAVTEMDFMEMTVSWWLTAIPDGVNMRELAPAIAAAKVIEAQAGGQKVVMPIDAGVKAWAVGCK